MTQKTITSFIIIILAIAAIIALNYFSRNASLPNPLTPSPDRVMQPYGKLPGDSAPAPTAEELVGTTWVWKQLIIGGDGVVAPNAPEKFTITFGADGSVSGTTDCNGFGGTYTLGSDGIISFGSFMSTLMYCEGSQESQFTSELAQATRLTTDPEGNLVMTLGETSNVLVFTKK